MSRVESFVLDIESKILLFVFSFKSTLVGVYLETLNRLKSLLPAPVRIFHYYFSFLTPFIPCISSINQNSLPPNKLLPKRGGQGFFFLLSETIRFTAIKVNVSISIPHPSSQKARSFIGRIMHNLGFLHTPHD